MQSSVEQRNWSKQMWGLSRAENLKQTWGRSELGNFAELSKKVSGEFEFLLSNPKPFTIFSLNLLWPWELICTLHKVWQRFKVCF
jgi:hypothetical protein